MTQDTVAMMQTTMGELNERLGVVFVEAGPERVVATMPVEGNRQPYGLLHGGASVALGETLGSTLAALNCPPDRAVPAGAPAHDMLCDPGVARVEVPAHDSRRGNPLHGKWREAQPGVEAVGVAGARVDGHHHLVQSALLGEGGCRGDERLAGPA